MGVDEASSEFWTITLRFRVVPPGSLNGGGRMWSSLKIRIMGGAPMAGEGPTGVSEASFVFWTITPRFRVVRPGSLDGQGRMWSSHAKCI
jgi:hypothetical protein